MDDKQHQLDVFRALVDAHVKCAQLQVECAQKMAEVVTLQIANCADAVRLRILLQAKKTLDRDHAKARREAMLRERRQTMICAAARSAAALVTGYVAQRDQGACWRDLWRLVQLSSAPCRGRIAEIKIGGVQIAGVTVFGLGTESAWQHFRMKQHVPEIGTPQWKALNEMYRCLEEDAAATLAALKKEIEAAQARADALQKQRWDEVDVLGSQGST